MGKFVDLGVYQETIEIGKSLKHVILTIPKDYRYDLGVEIKRLIRDIKYQIYLTNCRTDNEKIVYVDELQNMVNHLKILIDDGIEDNIFFFKGKNSIANALAHLKELTLQES